MSLWNMRSVIGVETTSDITTARHSRGAAISKRRRLSRVAPMLTTRNLSRFKMTRPQKTPMTTAMPRAR